MCNPRTLAQVLSAFSLFCTSNSFGCDLCALYRASQSVDAKKGAVHLSLSEQFTRYDKIQTEGRAVQNPSGERFTSSQTRVDVSYDLTDRLSLRGSIPLIAKRYRQLDHGEIKSGTESGIGDIALTTRFEMVRWKGDSDRVKLSGYAGIKLPTGDSDLLKEDHQSTQDHVDGEELDHLNSLFKHSDEEDEAVSAVHGHDLALGSGSVDFPLGITTELASDRVVLTTHFEYTIRNEGDHNYEYADDLSWAVGLGVYPVLEDQKALLLRANLGGEYKRKDRANGAKENDTALRSVFIGPEIIYSTADDLSVEVGTDIPIDINNSGTQAVMHYRIRAGVTWRF